MKAVNVTAMKGREKEISHQEEERRGGEGRALPCHYYSYSQAKEIFTFDSNLLQTVIE